MEKKKADTLSYENCRKILAGVEASRAYVRNVLRPTVTGLVGKGEFIPEAMSASFVARSQFEKFLEYYPDYYVKFASLNPRNPKNLADPEETRVLKSFQDDPGLSEWQGKLIRDGKEYFSIAKPFRFKKGCIRCHGKPEDAPQSLRLRYGDINGFGLKVGDVTMYSVGVPIQTAHLVIKNHFLEMLIPIILILAGIVLSTTLLFKRLVSRPLNTLKLSTQKVTTGEYNNQISLGKSEEFNVLAADFNKMAFFLQNSLKKLQKSEASLEEAQILAKIGNWSWNVDTSMMKWSKALYEIVGWDPKQPPPTFEEQSSLYTKDSMKILTQAIKKAVNSVTPYDLELQMVHPDGQVRFISTQGKAETDESGRVFRLYGTIQDVTERKRAEAALHEAHTKLEGRVVERTAELKLKVEEGKKLKNELQTEKDFLNTVLENIEDGVVACNSEGVLSKFNRATRDFHGLPQEELPAEQWAQHYDLYLADGKTPMEKEDIPLFRAFDGEHVQDVEMVIVPKQGRKKILLASGQSLFDSQNNKLGAVVSMHDITERKRAEDQLVQANIKLQELDRLKSMFIASMSHELRTPLNSIIGFTAVVLDGMTGELNPEQKDKLGRVHNAAEHLLSLITDIIDISRIESGKLNIASDDFILDQVVEESIDCVRADLDNKGLGLEISVPLGLQMRTDRSRLLQCILNFVNNAIKYSENGTISITAREIGNEVEIMVRDTGIGMGEKDMSKLFKAFERIESHMQVKAGGTGLGLYLTKKLATEVLGGTVSVESQLGQGSTFLLKVPKKLGGQ